MIISRTPFRVSFFGGGTDYPQWFNEHGGAVLSTTIDKYCYITARRLPRFFDYTTRVVYSKIELVNELDQIQHPAVRETLRMLQLPHGFDITHASDLPARAGLGASSSFVVGLLHSLSALAGTTPGRMELARTAIHVERDLLAEVVGCQDQVAATFGGLNVIRFGSGDAIDVVPVQIEPERTAALESRLLLYFTGILRNATLYAGRQVEAVSRNQVGLARIRAMVDEAVTILVGDGGLDDFGRLLHEAWTIKRGLAEGVSNSTIDGIYSAAREAGALGGKLLGAGGGGFMLLFVRPEDQSRVRSRLSGLVKVPFRFERSGTQLLLHQDE